MLTIKCDNNFYPEKKYIFDVLFKEFLELDYNIILDSRTENTILELDNGNQLIIKDHFFSQFKDGLFYINKENIPSKILYAKNDFIVQHDIPIIYGDTKIQFTEKNGKKIIICDIDILASVFFMLSRWEEVAIESRDKHNRFPANESLAFKNNFLERPIVNEYIEMLWNMLLKLDIYQPRKRKNFAIELTHDVDWPFLFIGPGNFTEFAKTSILRLTNGNLKTLLKQSYQYLTVKLGHYKNDPYYNFPYILNLSEKYNLTSTFFFLTENTLPIDGKKYIDNTIIKKLIREIHSRGHKIGLHGSYSSYNDNEKLNSELQKLKQILKDEKINQEEFGSRQHFLRWDMAKTPAILDHLGIVFDTTLSYADHIGFRCGTCYEYPMFELYNRNQLKLIEKPLIVMEGSILNNQYMNLNHEEALNRVIKLVRSCKFYHGKFTLLWHNSCFLYPKDKWLYENIITCI